MWLVRVRPLSWTTCWLLRGIIAFAMSFKSGLQQLDDIIGELGAVVGGKVFDAAAVAPSSSGLNQLNELISELDAVVGSRAAGEISASKVKNNNDKKKEKGDAKKNNKNHGAEKVAVVVAPAAQAQPAELTVNSLDFRVGVIRTVKRHETADKLYCEEIDVGEDEPRAIASGLVPFYSLEEMENRRLIVVCNLLPRKLVGFKSHGMVLCASVVGEDGKERVEFIDPPVGAKPGDRVFGEGLVGEPLSAKQCDKQKAFETIAGGLRVDEQGNATWNGIQLVTQSGEICTAPTIRNGSIR